MFYKGAQLVCLFCYPIPLGIHFIDPERVKDSSRVVRLRTPGKGIPQILHREPVTEMNIPLAILQNI